MFNDIRVIRGNKQVKVPINFLPRAKWYVLMKERQVALNADKPLTQVILPRISFNLSGMEYDATRARAKANAAYESVSSISKIQYQPVPYNFRFELCILTSSITDQLAIIEQIVPFFTPNFNLSIIDNPLAGTKSSDVTLRLDSVSINNDVEGMFDEKRVTSAELEFTMKGLIYGPSEDGSGNVIRDVEANIRDFDHQGDVDNLLAKYTATLDPFDAEEGDDYDIIEELIEY